MSDYGKWQPIETAPKDGTDVLLWMEDSDPFIGRWAPAVEFMTQRELDGCGLDDDAIHNPDWFYADFLQGGRLNETPTHWMPLPLPPVEGE